MQFGNRAFRSWHARLVSKAPALLRAVLDSSDTFDAPLFSSLVQPASSSSSSITACTISENAKEGADPTELAPYLEGSFGDVTRIDYGTGHETAFVCLLYTAHAMGGVGKTTIAATLVHDDQIRAAFSKIVWVSVGQEPDIRELQEAIHEQLLEKGITDSANTLSLVSTALRNAAKGVKVLLVCDDVWDPKHEKPLNCIDGDNGSRLLVTTRIQKLLNNSCEVSVGVLSENDALQLLLSSANMEEGSMPEGGDEHRIALEIVELCGRLPLTLAIAGAMISDHPKGFDDELVELMREDRLRDQDDDEDGNGTTLEERIVWRYTRPSPIFTLSISNDPRFTGNRSLHHSK